MNNTTNDRLEDSIIPGDCAEQLQRFLNGTIDLCVTDPPYIAKYKDRTDRRSARF